MGFAEWGTGAVGDGVTDDAPAIQAGIDAAFARGGGVVCLPGCATYLIGRTLVVRPRVVLTGVGQHLTTLKLRNGVNAPLLTLDARSQLRELTVDGNVSGQTAGVGTIAGASVKIVGDSVLITRTTITNAAGPAVYGTNVQRAEVSDSLVLSPGLQGIFFQGNCGHVRVLRNGIMAGPATNKGICIMGLDGTHPTDVSLSPLVEGNDVDMTLSAVATAVLGIEVWGFCPLARILHNDVTSTAGRSCFGISTDRCEGVRVGYNTLTAAPGGSFSIALEAAGSVGAHFSGNRAKGANVGLSISVSGGVVPNGVQAVGNHFETCATYGVQALNSHFHIIQGNTFVDCGTRYVFLNGAKRCIVDTIECLVRDWTGASPVSGVYLFNADGTIVNGVCCGPDIYTPGTSTGAMRGVVINGGTGATVGLSRTYGDSPSRPGVSSADKAIYVTGGAAGVVEVANVAQSYTQHFSNLNNGGGNGLAVFNTFKNCGSGLSLSQTDAALYYDAAGNPIWHDTKGNTTTIARYAPAV